MTDLQARLQPALRDRYQLAHELGHGGMAIVYLAQDLKHRRQVAVKVLRPELAHAVGPERFLREIEIAARLTHPNILPLYDSGEADGLLYYVMPYIAGESLRDRLKREPRLPIEEALRITREIADALAFAHTQGLIHRDIKPENILFQAGHALLSDFGIARAVSAAGGEQLTETGLALGTPAYMSPEQAFGEKELDQRTDVYGLGCVLFEMLTGSPPFGVPSGQAIMARHATDPVPSLRSLGVTVPPAVEDALSRALAKAPADRFSTAPEFAQALAASGTRGRSRRLRMAAGIAALVLLTGAGAALALVPQGIRAAVRTVLTRGRATLHPDRIVVAPFDNQTGDSTLDALGQMIADWVGRDLSTRPEYQVVDVQTAAITGRLVDRLPRFTRPSDRAIAIAEEVGAARLVAGSFYREGDTLRFESRILDVGSGRVLMAIPQFSTTMARKVDAATGLARMVGAALAASGDTLERSGPAYDVPPSYDAYRALISGWDAFVMSGLEDTTTLFTAMDQAWQQDTSYFYPYVIKIFVLQYRKQWARADSLVRFVGLRKERLAPAGRTTFEMLRAAQLGDLEGTRRRAVELLRYSAASPEAVGYAAVSALRVGDPTQALRILSDTDPRRGAFLVLPFYWTLRGQALHQLGRYDEEEQNALTGRRQFPTNADLGYHLVRAAAARGQAARVTQLLGSAFRGTTTTPALTRKRAIFAARELRAHGQREAALQIFRRELGAVAGDTSLSLALKLEYLYEGERYEEVRHLAHEALADDSMDMVPLGHLGATAARLGDTTEARRALRRLAAGRVPFLFGKPALWRAHISALLGDREAAVTLLREALQQGSSPLWGDGVLYIHQYPAVDMLRGYEPFEALAPIPQ